MQHPRELTSCLIGTGTVTDLRDMVRAMETVEGFEYSYVAEGRTIETGRATLVKIMADPESATILVNGCLFLNVASFRYLSFEALADGRTRFVLHGDGTTLEMVVTEDTSATEGRPMLRLIENGAFDPISNVMLDDEDDED
ncbi:MAG: hypothetical protein ABFC80_05515 [Coriobacteriales bacterium]|nr:hypothetical protein [Actinomycetes bacterium]